MPAKHVMPLFMMWVACQPSARGCLSGGSCTDAALDVASRAMCSFRTEARDCSGVACNLQTGLCATAPPYSLGLCKSCETDRECEGEACVRLNLGDQELGRYCLMLYDRGVGCPSGMKRVISASRTTENTDRAYCAPFEFATCEAMERFNAKQPCRTTEPMTCNSTGAFCDEGLLNPMNNSLENICTVLCGEENDCPRGARCVQSTFSGRKICQWPPPT